MTTITIDGTSIQTDYILTEIVSHESAPNRDVTRIPLARRDGSVFVAKREGEKVIKLRGTIQGDDQDDFEDRVDSFKELLSRKQVSLVVSWNGTTRLYTIVRTSHNLNRDFYNVDWAPWEAELLVSDGEGSDPASTSALSGESLDVSTPDTAAFTLGGSKPSKPTITLTGANWPSGCRGIEIQNMVTGEKMQITNDQDWGNTSVVVIDSDNLTVTHTISGTDYNIDFIGTVPNWAIGSNTIQVTAGRILVTGTTEDSIDDILWTSAMNGDIRYAYRFQVPYNNDTFQTFRLALLAFGSPTGNLTVEVHGDNGGEPDGSPVGSATYDSSNITTSGAYHTIEAAAPFDLEANTTYWLVVYGTGWTGANGVYWGHAVAVYGVPNGKMLFSSNDGSTWNDPSPVAREQAFELYYGGLSGAGNASLNVDYTKKWL